MTIVNDNLSDSIKVVEFPTVTWASGETSAKTTFKHVNMLLDRIDVLINQPTNNLTVNMTFADQNLVVVIDATNFTALDDGTKHIMLSTKIPADFSTITLNDDITITITPSGDPGATALTVTPIFKGA